MPVCNYENPMPRDRDQTGQHWLHECARPVEIRLQGGTTMRIRTLTGTLHRCPVCETEFCMPTQDDWAEIQKWLSRY